MAVLIIPHAGGDPGGIRRQGSSFCVIYSLLRALGERNHGWGRRGNVRMEGWGREKGPAKWDPDTPKAAGEAKPRDLELGKEDQELGPAWLGQGINSKGRDV